MLNLTDNEICLGLAVVLFLGAIVFMIIDHACVARNINR